MDISPMANLRFKVVDALLEGGGTVSREELRNRFRTHRPTRPSPSNWRHARKMLTIPGSNGDRGVSDLRHTLQMMERDKVVVRDGDVVRAPDMERLLRYRKWLETSLDSE